MESTSDVAIVLEPLIATSQTISAVLDILKGWGVKDIRVITIIASKTGLEKLSERHPDVSITCATIDEKMSSLGVVIPGLGDVGDRQFRGVSETTRSLLSLPHLSLSLPLRLHVF